MTDFIGPAYQMTCGSAEAESNVYHMQRVGTTVWLWKDGPGAGSNIYCGSDNPKSKSEGFGGRALTFQLVSGASITLYGPWHTSSDSLLRATGVDLTKTHPTFVVVGLGRRTDPGMKQVITDVIYQDDDWTEGAFDRGRVLARELATKRQEVVFAYCQSEGGSSCGPEYPDGWTQDQISEHWKQVEKDRR